jgi:hypothetical protein
LRRAARALVLLTGVAWSASAEDLTLHKGMRGVRLLGEGTAKVRGLKPGIGFDGSAEDGLWLADRRRLYEVREGTWLSPSPPGDLADLAFFRGDLVATCGKQLLVLDKGRFRKLVDLPYSAMRLVPRTDGVALILFGGREDPREVYQLFLDGTYEKVLRVDHPVTAVAELAGELLVAAGTTVLHVAPDRRVSRFHEHPEPILSLATDGETGGTYLAAPSGVYALTAEGPLPLMLQATGLLRFDGDFLLVMDPTSRQVLALAPREGAPAATAAPPSEGVPTRLRTFEGDLAPRR